MTALTQVPAVAGLERPPSISHAPAMHLSPVHEENRLARAEACLADWFGAGVLLFSSGRAALHMLLAELRFHRYEHRITVPRYLSTCILDVLNLNAFPVHESGADALLRYHQYGFLQSERPREPVVVEDICHAFFASPRSGARQWSGAAAIFSLPKVLSTYGPCGGVIVPDRQLYKRLAARRAEGPEGSAELLRWRRDIVAKSDAGDPQAERLLGAAYALLPAYVSPDPDSIPREALNLASLLEIAAARTERVERLVSRLAHRLPVDLIAHAAGRLPFAVPCFFANTARLEAADAELAKQGINAGIYHIDVARNLYEPDYRRGLLLPCHQAVGLDAIGVMAEIVNTFDR